MLSYEGVSAQVLSLLTVEHYKQLMTRNLLGRKVVVGEAKIKSLTHEAAKKKADCSVAYNSPEEFGRLLFEGKQVKVKTKFAEIVFTREAEDFEIKLHTL